MMMCRLTRWATSSSAESPGATGTSRWWPWPPTWTRSGFIIVGHTEDGFLRFRPIGGIDPRVVVSKWVTIGEDRLPGIISAPHPPAKAGGAGAGAVL